MKGTGQMHAASRGVVATLALLAYWLLKLALKISFRYVVGLPLDGNRTTDATFASDGTQLVDKKANFFGKREATKWALMAGWKRAAWRLGIPAGLLVTAAAWSAHPALIRTAATIAAGTALGYNGWRCYEWVRLRHHRTHYLEPLAEVLGERLGVDEKLAPADWIDLPLDFRAEHAVIVIDLPIRFLAGEDPSEAVAAWGRRTAGGERAVVNGIVSEKLGLSMSDMTAAFHMVGAEPYVEYRHMPRVPDLVTVDMAREAIVSAPASKPVLGLGRGSKVVAIDVDTDSPHILISCGSGGGKSWLVRCLIAQFLRNGAVVVVLDVKRTSQRWVKGHPHVIYARDIADIHDTLVVLDEEVDRRTRLIDDADEGDAMPYVGPRLVVVCEEMNMMTEMLTTYWAEVRDNKEDPKASPAVAAVKKLSLMGREPLIHLIAVGQLMTAKAAGGNESRENFGARVLGRYTANAWRMLAPEILMPRASRRSGRVQVTMGGSVDETQAIGWKTEEAREWAWSCFKDGRQVTASQRPMRALFRGESPVTVSDPSQHESNEPRELADSPSHHLVLLPGGGSAKESAPSVDVPASQQVIVGEVVGEEEELVTLRQAVRRRIVTVSPEEKKAMFILWSARRRDNEFPAVVRQRGREYLYRPSDLQRWERNRPNSEGAAG